MGIFTFKVAGDASILSEKLTNTLKDNISSEEGVLFCLRDAMESHVLIALTSRILIIKSGLFGPYKATSFLYRDIISIETTKGIMSNSLNIYTSMDDTHKRGGFLALLPGIFVSELHNSFSFENIFLPTFLPYIEKIKVLVQECKKQGESSDQKSDDSEATKSNIAEQIEKLSNLRQSGALTEEEYLQAKKKILEA